MFNKGIPSAGITSIPIGGHTAPISTEGTKLAAKNAQKKRKITSLLKK